VPFDAKFSPPDPAHCTYRHPRLNQAAQTSRTIFNCLPGYLDTECLSAILHEQGRQFVWLRLEPEDGDPATFILSLLQAAQAQVPGIGADLLADLRHHPGPLVGWPPLFHHLADILTKTMGQGGALILEHVHKPSPTQPILGLASHHLIPYLPAESVCILITHERLPASALPDQAILWSSKDVELEYQAGLAMANDLKLCLPDKVVKRAIHLLDGRAGALKALFAACEMFGQEFLQEAIEQCRDASHMLSIILSRWFASFTDEEIENLVLCTRVEYTHPDLFGAQPVNDSLRCPWLQPLSWGWRRVRCLWETPLRSALRNRAYVELGLAKHLALRLDEIGAVEHSIRLLCWLSDYQFAAQVIAEHADQWMDLGQWELLENYLNKLPAKILEDHPQLLFLQGELLALHGMDFQANHIFQKSTRLFFDQGDASGRCLSLLAESALSARHTELDKAQNSALSALEIARQARLPRLCGWAEWQLGCLAISLDRLSEALAHLARSLEDSDDRFIHLVQAQVMELVRQKVQSQEMVQSYHEAYLNAERISQQASVQLNHFLSRTIRELPGGLAPLGWNDLPVMTRLSLPVSTPHATDGQLSLNWRERLQRRFSRVVPKQIGSNSGREAPANGDLLPLQLLPMTFEPKVLSSLAPESSPSLKPTLEANEPAISREKPIERPKPRPLPITPQQRLPSLAIFCLGPLRVIQKEKEITEWTSFKARDIFKYLAARPETQVPKDILIDVFWPEADIRAARRNLHQAIYSLRQTLRGEQPEFHHVWFENERYFLNPQMDIWLDYKEFERYVVAGQKMEKVGNIDEAMGHYETAVELYQGDFLEDDLYEDWPVIQRQNLLTQFLSVSDRLVELYLEKGQYAAAAPLCQKILSKDRTYETAHRQLMQCYLAQGLRHLAVRQYQTCVRTLREELAIQPSNETAALYKQALAHYGN
jgi:DNA-binding SARP family transcriptional activator